VSVETQRFLSREAAHFLPRINVAAVTGDSSSATAGTDFLSMPAHLCLAAAPVCADELSAPKTDAQIGMNENHLQVSFAVTPCASGGSMQSLRSVYGEIAPILLD
jgi:hypothetical protein